MVAFALVALVRTTPAKRNKVVKNMVKLLLWNLGLFLRESGGPYDVFGHTCTREEPVFSIGPGNGLDRSRGFPK